MKMNWNIYEIENLTEAEAAKMANEKTTVKGEYNCYFIDFGGAFGYSVCVFADGQHIKYVNDYELHHIGKNRAELREIYAQKLNRAIFSEAELGTVEDYNDADFVRHMSELLERLEAAKNAHDNDREYWFSAYLYEMCNHEYGINWQADYDVISAFANVDSVKDYTNVSELFELAGFSAVQKAAYMDARRAYYKQDAANL